MPISSCARTPLCLSLATALILAAPALPASVLADHVNAALLSAPVQPSGSVDLSRLSTLFGAAGGRAFVPDGRPVTWVREAALGDAVTRRMLQARLQAYHEPILLLRTPPVGNDQHVEAVFGLSSAAELLLFFNDAQGVHAFALDHVPSLPEKAGKALTAFIDVVADALQRRQSATDTIGPDDLAMRPRMKFTATSMSAATGGFVTMTGQLARHVQRDGSALRLAMKSIHALAPAQVGLIGSGEGPADQFRRLSVPRTYYASHSVDTRNRTGAALASKLLEWQPRDDGRTDINIDTTRSTSTTYGLNVAPEVGRDFNRVSGLTAASRLAAGLGFSRTNNIENRIAYSVRDYSVFSQVHPPGGAAGQVQRLEWRHPLADVIANNRDYFRKGAVDAYNTEARMTPSMRGITVETYSEWELPAAGIGATLAVTASSTIQNIIYAASTRDESVLEQEPGQRAATWTIALDTPYLTREATVRLVSRKGDGGCLVDNNGVVALIACHLQADVHRRARDQWQLDNHSRYVNRLSGRCLSVSPAGAATPLRTEPCSLALSQQWIWYADRIHSLYDGASRDWRLWAGSGGQVFALPTAQHPLASFPVNGEYPLLSPWSGYPSRPVAGDTVPTFGQFPQRIPESYLELPAVDPGERWDAQLIRQPSAD